MILLLGATSYVGQAFARELRRRGHCFIPLSRHAFDYARFDLLFDYIRRIHPSLVINASGHTGRLTVDDCEKARMETFQTMTLLPQTISRVCQITNTPLGHISSGAIFSGAKIFHDGEMRLERELNKPEVRRLFETHPERFFGFTELDEPNFSFRQPPCNFLAGTEALAEEALRGAANTYIWRRTLPFSEHDSPYNLLSKLQAYAKVYDHITGLSHVDDFVRACLDLTEQGVQYGTYNVTNPGAVTTRQVVEMIHDTLKPERTFSFWRDDEEFYSAADRAPRSSSLLDVTKLLRAGVKIRPLDQALADALAKWSPATRNQMWTEETFETASANS